MKYMEDINKMQAILTKFRREVQREEVRPEGPKCSTCGKPAVGGQGTALYATIHFCEDHRPTAGECDRYYKLSDGRTQCRECGWIVSNGCNCIDRADPGRKQKRHTPNSLFGTDIPKDIIDKLIKHPDLPLHVRVAKANGHEVSWNTIREEWLYQKESGDLAWRAIPDYPNDLVAVWAAFDTYCEQNDLMWKIERTHTGQGYIGLREIHAGWDISKEGDKVVMYHLKGETLAENFCEAIVAHAEANNG